MKKLTIVILLTLSANWLSAQSLSQTTIKRFSFGGDIFTDIWMNHPEGATVRGINQGVNVFGMYNFPIGESNFSFAIGVGMGFHNLYSKSVIEDIKADTIKFMRLPDTVAMKRTKLGLSYIDLPLEFRFKTPSKFRAAIGVKVGYLVDAKVKYKYGKADIEKAKQVSNVEKFRFGPTVRVGYSWFSVFAYYSVTKIFRKNRGPDELYPISVGITFLPF
jgi:hypothetical protein